jgi:predicted MPP superfamily phosphohydrolase
MCASLFSLGVGWYLAHNVWQTDYRLVTPKNIQDLKIIMFADAHIGTTFSGDGFVKHMETINALHPDVVIIAGDFVDDSTKREDMTKSCKALGNIKSKYGIYFVLGNHDRGYYKSDYRGFSLDELIAELKKNNVIVLRDEAVLLDNLFYIIGRQDASSYRRNSKQRKSMSELIANLDDSKYMIVIDHQPTDTINQANSKVDLVLSGHTHGGQLFPFNKVGEWIGANDITYGLKNTNKTNFIVTSGISDWEIKFKTGTKSEYVVINVGNK